MTCAVVPFPIHQADPISIIQRQLDELVQSGQAVHSALVVTQPDGNQVVARGRQKGHKEPASFNEQDDAISKLMELVAKVRRGDVIGLAVVKTLADLEVTGELILEPKRHARRR